MKICLLFPPGGCLTHPYLSIPSLTAFLRSDGHEVIQHDVGIGTVDEMLTPAHLRKLHEFIQERIDRLSAATTTTKRNNEHLNALLAADLFAPDVIANIERAKSILRSRDLFCRVDEYTYASNAIERALDVVSAAHFPTKVTHNRCSFKTLLTFDNIYALTDDESLNPFLNVMRGLVLPGVLPKISGLVGISVTYGSQIIPGYTLARLIRASAPAAHIVMGGAIITSAEKRIRVDARAFEYVDSYVFGEGESALAHLIEIVESGYSIPNKLDKLYLKQDFVSRRKQRIAIENKAERERFEELPSPDYSGLNLGDYLSPETVFLVSNGRGCYYGKCNFCNVSLTYRNECQQRSPETLRRDIQSLQKKHGARFFFFADDCVTPKRCSQIADFASELDHPIFWQTEIRFEKEFAGELLNRMYRGGCRQIMIGNESGNQRILDLMKKNTRVETSTEIIRNAAKAGLAVYISNFLGFPGETTDEARETIDFLVSLREYLTSVALVTYEFVEFSRVHRNPRAFGIERMWCRNAQEFIPHFYFSTSSGPTTSDVERVYREAVQRLGRVYPCQDRFLDGIAGAHVLLHLVFSGERKIERIFPQKRPPRDLSHKRPRLRAAVWSRRLGRGKTVLYSSKTGRLATLGTAERTWLALVDGERSLAEIIARCGRASSRKSPRAATANAAAVMVTACDLHQAGFIDLH